jgi:phage terminase large subunit-like protein
VRGGQRVEPRDNAIVITAQATGSAKIDPLMAMFNAIDRHWPTKEQLREASESNRVAGSGASLGEITQR